MTVLDLADDLRLGADPVDAAYLGADQVWSAGFSPRSIAALVGWWDFSRLGLSDATPIDSVPDLSGNGRTLTGSGSQRPLAKTNIQNGRATALFDGGDDRLLSGSVAWGTTGITVLAAGAMTAAGSYPMLTSTWGDNNVAELRSQSSSGHLEIATNDGGATFGLDVSDGSWHAIVGWFGDGDGKMWIGVDAGTGFNTVSTTGPGTGVLALGNRAGGGQGFSGYFGEVLVCDEGISGADRAALMAYLKDGWATL